MKTFILKWILVFSPIIIAFVFAAYLGESLPWQLIANWQIEGQSIIYGPKGPNRTHDQTLRYKRYMIESIKPDVLVMGSSLSVSYQSPMFVSSFYNAASPDYSPREVYSLLMSLSKDALPEVLLLEISPGWFKLRKPIDDIYNLETLDPFSSSDTIITATAKTLMDWLNGKFIINSEDKDNYWLTYGLRARGDGWNRGYRPDGSMYRGTIDNVSEIRNRRIAGNAQRLFNNEWIFDTDLYGKNDYTWDHLSNILALAEQNDVKVIGIIPPFEPLFYNVVSLRPEYSEFIDTIAELSQLIDSYNGTLVNLQDIRAMSIENLDFVDAYHPSERITLQMMMYIAEQVPDLQGDYVNLSILEQQFTNIQNPYDLYYSNEEAGVTELYSPLYTPNLPTPKTETEALLILFNQINQIVPDNHIILSLRGQVYAEMGQTQKALEDLQQAIAIAPVTKQRAYQKLLDQLNATN